MKFAIGGKWAYSALIDEGDNEIGVEFSSLIKGIRHTILFAGNDNLCLDWASMPRSDFFDKYANEGNRHGDH